MKQKINENNYFMYSIMRKIKRLTRKIRLLIYICERWLRPTCSRCGHYSYDDADGTISCPHCGYVRYYETR